MAAPRTILGGGKTVTFGVSTLDKNVLSE